MMGATFVMRNCISQQLSANSSTRLPASITLLQNRVHFRSFGPPIELHSFLAPMSSCCLSPCSVSVDSGFARFRLRTTRGGGGGLQLPSAAVAPSRCCRPSNLSSSFVTKLSFSSWKEPQSNLPKWKKMITFSKVECTSQAGGAEKSSSSSSSVLPAVEAKPTGTGLRITFCPRCGGTTEKKVPDGEHELRVVCTVCSAIHYENPKMVVGCLVEHENQILLCKRSIEPSYGLWTLPAGYMEIGESAAEGAARETREEACAEVEVLGLFAHLDIPIIGQSYIIFRAQLKNPHFAPGPESLECELFNLDELPFDKLAFSSIGVALNLYLEDVKSGSMRVHHGVIDKRPGAALSDPKGFVIRDHLCS
ncbi:hypothetical protein Mapa_012876 [Marchantia paleacea]|nr:hypothetical protein Mapa_012876 [Marchantia paleacea]